MCGVRPLVRYVPCSLQGWPQGLKHCCNGASERGAMSSDAPIWTPRTHKCTGAMLLRHPTPGVAQKDDCEGACTRAWVSHRECRYTACV